MPYYVRPSEAGIVAHFRAVADASPVPVVVYNIPPRPVASSSAAGMLELADAQHRRASSRPRRRSTPDTLELLAGAPDDFSVLGGEDPCLFPLVLMGGAGAICASAHVCTERFVAMIECGLAGKVDDGRAHAEALLPVVQAALRRAEPGRVQGRAPRAGADPDARRAPAAG